MLFAVQERWWVCFDPLQCLKLMLLVADDKDDDEEEEVDSEQNT